MAQLRRHNACVGEASFDLVYEILSGASADGKRGRIIPASLHRELPTNTGITKKPRNVRVAQFSRTGPVGSWNSIRQFLGRGTSRVSRENLLPDAVFDDFHRVSIVPPPWNYAVTAFARLIIGKTRNLLSQEARLTRIGLDRLVYRD